jgi:AmiR/NasT family two-component response regulator
MSEEIPHREAIQSVAHLTLGRIERDLSHVDSIFDEFNVYTGEAMDALTTLSEVAATVHALMHRLDDGLLKWANEKHVAAALVEGIEE